MTESTSEETEAATKRNRKALTRVKLDQFTAFSNLDLEFSPGINVFVGANGTGKTHLMKACYAACDISKTGESFAEKLVRVFLPSGRVLGRLIKRRKGSTRGAVEVFRGDLRLRASFSNHATVSKSATVTGAKGWVKSPIESVYIPAKEVLSNAPGFQSLYREQGEITCRTTSSYLGIEQSAIEEAFTDLYDREVRRSLGSLAQ